MKCLQKYAVDRYQSTDEFLEDLRQLKNQSQVDKTTINAATGKLLKTRQTRIISVIVITFALLALLAGYFFFSKESEPAGRVPIAVVDFVNQTNEPELNGLSGMLITALEQSRHLAVMSRARMYDEFKQMNRTDLIFVDEAAGREIAKRTNITALAVATIRNFDNLYSIDFKVIDPQSGDRLFSTKVEAEGKRNIPGLLDQLAEKTRIDLKEEKKTLQFASRGVAEVTTTNLEAYHHYFLGEQLMSRMEIQAAREEYKKAIELDSTFGLAYYRLANAYTWGFAHDFAKEPVEKAFELIDRIPEKERYLLRAVATNVEKGHSAAIPVAKEMERYYPDGKEMLYFIADWSFHANQHQQAIE
jgi:TolB-like protein